jgi:hypothetical protein
MHGRIFEVFDMLHHLGTEHLTTIAKFILLHEPGDVLDMDVINDL